jgi:TonB family protein
MGKSEIWKSWEGRSVNGKFPLRQWLGGSDHSAVFLTERPGPTKAAIKLIAADAAGMDQEVSRLRATIRLSHPHLIRTYEAGRSQMEGTPFIFVVMDFAEEDLSQILPQRALAPNEVSDLLPPVLDALTYLHNKGFVHSRIKPSNILAVGDQLKLSADPITPLADAGTNRRRRDVYDAPETAAGIVSTASDVWSVGVTLIAALTQNVTLAEKASPNNSSLPDTIAEPFRGIARECLQLDPKRRCSVQQIQARLQPAARSVPAQPKPAASPAPGPDRRPIVAVALVVIALVIVVAVLHSRGKNSSAAPPETTPQPVAEAKPSPAPEVPLHEPARKSSPKPVEAPRKAGPSGGSVTHQVVPDIPKSARNTITGTIKVTVEVDVDSSGKVTAAKLKTAGPSRYFAGKALAAAQGWEFSPPQANGQPTTSAWLLQFHFRRSGTDASPERLNR